MVYLWHCVQIGVTQENTCTSEGIKHLSVNEETAPHPDLDSPTDMMTNMSYSRSNSASGRDTYVQFIILH